jgi:hypothetical protein
VALIQDTKNYGIDIATALGHWKIPATYWQVIAGNGKLLKLYTSETLPTMAFRESNQFDSSTLFPRRTWTTLEFCHLSVPYDALSSTVGQK